MAWYDIDACRKAIAKKYDSPNWKYKVKHMSDEQVIAIYNRMFVDKPKHKKASEPIKTNTYEQVQERVDPVVVKEDYYCEQLAFDI